MNEKFIIHNGDVRSLKVYRLAAIVSVITEVFVDRFISRGSRTTDQMQQAARSCKQNIVEGSAAAPTSKETEIKLTNVARASLSELEEDYIDYLRFKQLSRWEKGHPRLYKLRTYLCSPRFESEYRELVCRLPAEEFCNLAITLIRQTHEAMSRARREYRANHSK